MTQVNMLEAKTELSKLVRKLETREDDVIYIARNGVPVVKMTLAEPQQPTKRIGVVKGKFTIPEEFDAWDAEIEKSFGDTL